jgi:hypothetical protein
MLNTLAVNMAVNEASKKQNIFGFYQNKAKLNSSYWP